MFKTLYKYFYNLTDTPSIVSKLNLWALVNIKIFKTKVTTSMIYFITGLDYLRQKKIKIFHKNFNFDGFYLFFVLILLLLLSILFFLL